MGNELAITNHGRKAMIPIKYYIRSIKFLADKHSDSGTEQTQHSA